ncbi:LAETG motif-containing sortase-dependent surface protein [Streptomyces sp. B1866]|uniref:LAETG motif-containing sortase-dependent surface protein n=1 Tax=Streptomyces sp. B1866 TaxID=3075431 RepID=UPI00288D0E35|nr:LAETG motif-containing sortase-dependent surface protein [Streptomyces sp. B1866]MDT3399061.1 LAETG motif-containing sortase-dependent surface protein [Streptomyces sp. B1866]
MQLRRALATVAATAAIAPAALLAAPAAHATDGPSTGPSTAAPSASPATQSPVPASPSASATPDTSPSASATPSATPSQKPSGHPSASASPTATPGRECTGEEGDGYIEDPDLTTTLSGLPSKVVAGSGFHSFTFRVKNSSDRSYQRVDFGVFAATARSEDDEPTGRYLTLQYRDPDTGAWRAVSTGDDDPDQGYIGYTDVRPHETLTLDLRLKVAASAPTGVGFAISVGVYADGKGNCVYSTGDYYEFTVLKAGTKPGDVPGAKPQGGKKPLPAKPQGNTRIDPDGSLAETGSASQLPMIATVGGVAVVAGAGAVFVVRRRRAGAGAA